MYCYKITSASENPRTLSSFGRIFGVGKHRVWRSLKATVKKWLVRLEKVWLYPEQSTVSTCGLLPTVFSVSVNNSKDLQQSNSLAKQHTPEGCVCIRIFLLLIMQIIFLVWFQEIKIGLCFHVLLWVYTLLSLCIVRKLGRNMTWENGEFAADDLVRPSISQVVRELCWSDECCYKRL